MKKQISENKIQISNKRFDILSLQLIISYRKNTNFEINLPMFKP